MTKHAEPLVGDLVRPRTVCAQGRNVGLVMSTGEGVFEDQIKVLWDKPVWYDPDDGYSVEYGPEMEVISAARR